MYPKKIFFFSPIWTETSCNICNLEEVHYSYPPVVLLFKSHWIFLLSTHRMVLKSEYVCALNWVTSNPNKKFNVNLKFKLTVTYVHKSFQCFAWFPHVHSIVFKTRQKTIFEIKQETKEKFEMCGNLFLHLHVYAGILCWKLCALFEF